MTIKLAYDRARISVRRKDVDGRLHVEKSPISKANICGYLGKEIPDHEKLGLSPDRLYKLYRHPDELAKGASTFNHAPILSQHIPVSSHDPQKEHVIGATGSNSDFTHPYLSNSLVVWDQAAINDIENGEKREISSAYRYRPDMTPGNIDGEDYDGVMRDLVANHVAIVSKGRAGSDVVVGDSALINEQEKERLMPKEILSKQAFAAKSKLLSHLRSGIAQDSEIENLIDLLEMLQVNPELEAEEEVAEDEGTEEKVKDTDSKEEKEEYSKEKKAEDEDETSETADDELADKIKAILGDKVSAEDISNVILAISNTSTAEDEEVDEKNKGKDEESKEPEVKDSEKDKPAMDSAIASAVKAAEKAILTRINSAREAERFVEPVVGKLAIACDSAEEVYKAALKTLNVDVTGVHATALPHIFKAYANQAVSNSSMANDSARTQLSSEEEFNKRFPNAARIRNIQ